MGRAEVFVVATVQEPPQLDEIAGGQEVEVFVDDGQGQVAVVSAGPSSCSTGTCGSRAPMPVGSKCWMWWSAISVLRFDFVFRREGQPEFLQRLVR